MLSKIKRFKGDYIVYLLSFIVLAALATVLLPFITDWGMKVLDIVTAAVLISYSLFFLLPKLINKKNKLVVVFTFIEFLFVLMLGISNILTQFKIVTFNINTINLSVGVAFLLRGLTELVSDYTRKEHKKKFIYFLLDVLIYSFGLYLIIKPLFSDEQILYVLIAFFYALSLFSLFLSIKFWEHKARKPKKAKKAKVKENKKEEVTEVKEKKGE